MFEIPMEVWNIYVENMLAYYDGKSIDFYWDIICLYTGCPK